MSYQFSYQLFLCHNFTVLHHLVFPDGAASFCRQRLEPRRHLLSIAVQPFKFPGGMRKRRSRRTLPFDLHLKHPGFHRSIPTVSSDVVLSRLVLRTYFGS